MLPETMPNVKDQAAISASMSTLPSSVQALQSIPFMPRSGEKLYDTNQVHFFLFRSVYNRIAT